MWDQLAARNINKLKQKIPNVCDCILIGQRDAFSTRRRWLHQEALAPPPTFRAPPSLSGQSVSLISDNGWVGWGEAAANWLKRD